MENSTGGGGGGGGGAAAGATTAHGRRDPSVDAVKAQGILTSLTAKERRMVREWSKHWSFYSRSREMLEEEALASGMSVEEYRAALRTLSGEPAPAHYPVHVDPSPRPPPPTSSGSVGWRATCQLERYGRLVKTQRDYPLRVPLPPGQIYDPYKQTFIFLGIECGDPISYRLPARGDDAPEEAARAPLQPAVAPLCHASLEHARRRYNIH